MRPYEADHRLPKKTSDEIVAHHALPLPIRSEAHEMPAAFSGRMPHCASVVPGGVTEVPSVDEATTFLWRLKEPCDFIGEVYLPDVPTHAEAYRDDAEIGVGRRRFLSCGAFDLDSAPDVTHRERSFPMGRVKAGKLLSVDPSGITEVVTSRRDRGSVALPPTARETVPDPFEEGAYSWIEAPRYEAESCEVGPLARAVISRAAGTNPGLRGPLPGRCQARAGPPGTVHRTEVNDAIDDLLTPGRALSLPLEAAAARITEAPVAECFGIRTGRAPS